MKQFYLCAFAAAVFLYLANPDRSMERCLLTNSFDTCHEQLNR